MVADRTLAGGVGPELADERLDLAPLVRLHRRRPGLLGLGYGARRLGPRDAGGRDQEHGGEEQRTQELGIARCAPGEEDALDRREVREDGEDPQRGLEHVKESAGDQTDHALGTLHHAHGAAHADRLGPGSRVAHHHRADQPRHRDDGAARVGHLREEHDDAEQHHQIGIPVDDRVEKRSERRHLAGGARQRAVEEVAEAGQDEQGARAPRPAGAERRRGQQAHAEPDDGQVVRATAWSISVAIRAVAMSRPLAASVRVTR